jgi:hypothetical protein
MSLPELMLNILIAQQLFLATLGEPTAAMDAIIDAARHVAADQLD